jgi:hypothetical protein
MKGTHFSQQITNIGTSRRVNHHRQRVCDRMFDSVCRSDAHGGWCHTSAEHLIYFQSTCIGFLTVSCLSLLEGNLGRHTIGLRVYAIISLTLVNWFILTLWHRRLWQRDKPVFSGIFDIPHIFWIGFLQIFDLEALNRHAKFCFVECLLSGTWLWLLYSIGISKI